MLGWDHVPLRVLDQFGGPTCVFEQMCNRPSVLDRDTHVTLPVHPEEMLPFEFLQPKPEFHGPNEPVPSAMTPMIRSARGRCSISCAIAPPMLNPPTTNGPAGRAAQPPAPAAPRRHPRRTIPCGSGWRVGSVKRSNPRTATTQIHDEDEEPTFGHEQGPALRKNGLGKWPHHVGRAGHAVHHQQGRHAFTRASNFAKWHPRGEPRHGSHRLDGRGQLVFTGHGRDGTHRTALCRSCTPSAAQWRGAGVVTQNQRAAPAGGDVHIEVPHQAVKTDAGRVTLVEEAVAEFGVAVGVDVREEVGRAKEVDLPSWLSPEPASTIRKRSTPAGSVHVRSRESRRRRPWCSGGHGHHQRWPPRWPHRGPPGWSSRSSPAQTA